MWRKNISARLRFVVDFSLWVGAKPRKFRCGYERSAFEKYAYVAKDVSKADHIPVGCKLAEIDNGLAIRWYVVFAKLDHMRTKIWFLHEIYGFRNDSEFEML